MSAPPPDQYRMVVLVEAIQFDGNQGPIAEWLMSSGISPTFSGAHQEALMFRNRHEFASIQTAHPGDWIVRQSDGVYRVFAADVFARVCSPYHAERHARPIGGPGHRAFQEQLAALAARRKDHH